MDYTHILAFLAAYLPTIGGFLRDIFKQWLDARYLETPAASQLPTGDPSGWEGWPRMLANLPTHMLTKELARRDLETRDA